MSERATEQETTGPRNLITDIEGLRVGHAEDKGLRSGTSVLVGDAPFTAGVHIMGGAPGTRETQLLVPDRLVQQVDALVLSGGSAFGLAAADGVAAGLRTAGRGFDAAGHLVPIVPAAILFDLANGGDKAWEDNPYSEMGAAALSAATYEPALGSVGAGAGATTADLVGGFGSASARIEGGYTIGAMVAANPLGSVVAGSAGQFWAAPWELGAEFGARGTSQTRAASNPPTKLNPQATTIAIVATDADLDQAACTRMATAAHDGMARAIVPSHTLFDGDLVFGVSTGQHSINDPMLDPIRLGHSAACVLARAIARAIYHASSWADGPGGGLPSWQDRYGKS